MSFVQRSIGCLWSLFLAVILTVGPLYWEVSVDPLPPLEERVTGEPDSPEVLEGRIARNQTLAATLIDYDIPASIADQVSRLVRPVFDVRRIRFGNVFKIEKGTDGTLHKFEYSIDDERVLKVERGEGDFEARVEKVEFDVRDEVVTAEIRSSLFGALEFIPRGETLAMELAEIFAWDVDFSSDIQPGDQIHIMVDTLYREGEFVKYGRIRAAELVNDGRTFEAFRFNDGYYDRSGNALKRSLLKSPLKFTRVSSGFTRRRMHPILGTFRSHLAVDYAAPTGSPVVAVASGRVVASGWSGGLGQYVEIQHANGLRTGYAHLSRISVGAKKGAHLKQGDSVGLVGKTGLATGAHLHYIMKRNGQPVNPLSIKTEPAVPLAAGLKPEFLRQVAAYRDRMAVKLAHHRP